MEIGKLCKHCEKFLPYSEFGIRKEAKDGYKNKCNSCRRKAEEKKRREKGMMTKEERIQSRKPVIVDGYKVCTECKESKKLEEFYLQNKAKGTRQAKCKECKNKYHHQYHKDNAEKLRERTKKYAKENAEWKKEFDRQYYLENINKIKIYKKQHQIENAEHYLKYRKDNAERIKEKKREYLKTENGRAKTRKHNNKRRARINNALTDGSTIEDLLKRDGYICHYCKCKIHNLNKPIQDLTQEERRTKATEDHIIALNNGGTDTIDNKVVACFSCNSAKGTKSYDEYFEIIAKEEQP